MSLSVIIGLLCIQVQEVVGVMRNNIDKVLERDSKLNDLDYRQTQICLKLNLEKKTISQSFQPPGYECRVPAVLQEIEEKILVAVRLKIFISMNLKLFLET